MLPLLDCVSDPFVQVLPERLYTLPTLAQFASVAKTSVAACTLHVGGVCTLQLHEQVASAPWMFSTRSVDVSNPLGQGLRFLSSYATSFQPIAGMGTH